ncbi:(2Fe-2S)-binding protein [Salipiger marinus]|uniref:(2Fe-2S)-binding protein n=1 Tax=Salipiger marinus TaxID=555512 RepID=UPI001E524058|nr:(2Fe-2S)-binding protein [Salipiger manganoxidans]MCD1617991.1 (2Fe-2S)-binding protein [Salipiger manganoxidans]MEB3418667.1 (2Fe-2S)-binding protein [Salipiger manganoxidans]
MVEFTVNGRAVALEGSADKPLLWALREDLGILGPKFGCGVAECGACRVLIDGQSVPSCQVFVGDLSGARVVTVEGLAQPDGQLSAVQQAWLDEQVPQCGYCQPGFLIAVTALLSQIPNPSDAQIDEAITNICRCGTYPRIRRAIHRAAATLSAG